MAVMSTNHHAHAPKPNQCTSTMVQKVRAPLPLVWSLLRRFDQPQAYKTLVKNCTMLAGRGAVGSVREVVFITGLPCEISRERLDKLDDDAHLIAYSVVEGDQRLDNYQSTTTVHEIKGGGGSVVVESYVVDVPAGNTAEDTRCFVNTVLGVHLRTLANVTENLAKN